MMTLRHTGATECTSERTGSAGNDRNLVNNQQRCFGVGLNSFTDGFQFPLSFSLAETTPVVLGGRSRGDPVGTV